MKENTSNNKSPKSNKEVEKLKNEISMLNDKNLRLMAEMQNLQRRYSEELLNMKKRDGQNFIKDFLPIIDNFERAIKMDDNNLDDEVSKFLEGFKMIYANMLSNLSSKGVKEIDALGKDFDPNIMEAVLTEKVDGINSNEVIEVLQKGYLYNDILLRPAMVKVAE